jgi:hypothetical protein
VYPILPRQELRRRLLTMLDEGGARKGPRGRPTADLRVSDIARYIGKQTTYLWRIAHNEADFTDEDQARVSRILVAYERGALVKTISTSGKAELKWQDTPAQTLVARRDMDLRIVMTKDGPRFKRTPIA